MISSSTEEVANILQCSAKQWNALEGGIGEDAEIIIDMKCPEKLTDIQLINGVGDFGTKRFSIFGSQNSTWPWTWIYTGELMEGRTEVCQIWNYWLSFYYIFRTQSAAAILH